MCACLRTHICIGLKTCNHTFLQVYTKHSGQFGAGPKKKEVKSLEVNTTGDNSSFLTDYKQEEHSGDESLEDHGSHIVADEMIDDRCADH